MYTKVLNGSSVTGSIVLTMLQRNFKFSKTLSQKTKMHKMFTLLLIQSKVWTTV